MLTFIFIDLDSLHLKTRSSQSRWFQSNRKAKSGTKLVTSLYVHTNAQIKINDKGISACKSCNKTFSSPLMSNLLALLTDSSLAIEIELGGSAVAVCLAVSLNVLDELSDTEQVVHLLERKTLGLGDEEPHEEEHGEAEGAVDEEGTATILV